MAELFSIRRAGSVGDSFSLRLARRTWRWPAALLFSLAVALAPHAAHGGTLVNFSTTVGSLTRVIQVDLFDDVTPQTVANFLNYVDANRYQDTIIHRDAAGFVLQGGGYKTADFEADPLPTTPTHIDTFASPQNEFKISNDRAGTIAMAKLGGNPNSATSEWFFNLGDNASNLDNQNGGFTVFGWTVGNGLSVVNSIAALTPTPVPFPGYPNNPVQNPFYTVPEDAQGNFVNVNSITVAMTHPSFQNPILVTDVNNDNQTTPNDALIVINSLLSTGGSHEASADFIDTNYFYFDPSGNGTVSPQDALIVINALLAKGGSSSAAPLAAPMFTVVPEPSSLALAVTALAALSAGAWRRLRRRRLVRG